WRLQQQRQLWAVQVAISGQSRIVVPTASSFVIGQQTSLRRFHWPIVRILYQRRQRSNLLDVSFCYVRLRMRTGNRIMRNEAYARSLEQEPSQSGQMQWLAPRDAIGFPQAATHAIHVSTIPVPQYEKRRWRYLMITPLLYL